MYKFVFALLVVFTLVLSQQTLSFKDNKFKIVQFTDLHFGERDWQDDKTLDAQRKILQIEKPNLVVLSGDALTGYWGSPSKEEFEHRWKKMISPMKDMNVPWAFINGNHDAEGPFTAREVVDLDGKLGGLSQNCPKDLSGSSNYVLSIFNKEKIAMNLFMFDSGNTGCHGKFGWSCVPSDVVDWYQKKSTELIIQTNETLPAISFVHIPLQELMAIWNYAPCKGTKGENSGCSIVNTGLLRAFMTQRDVVGVFSGHDHKNDYSGYFNHIKMAYGRKSGYGGYDSGLPIGARVIELSLEPKWKMKSWIRQDDGNRAKRYEHKAEPLNPQIECDKPEERSESVGWLAIIMIISFCLLLIGVGIYFHKSKSKTRMDGRKFV